MPHRVDLQYQMTLGAAPSTSQPQPAPPPAAPSEQRRSPYNRSGRVSPPPIVTLPAHSASPSPSNGSPLDRSAVSTPSVGNGARRSSPPPQSQQSHPQQQQQAPPPPHHLHYTDDMQRYPPGMYMYGPLLPPQYAQHPHPHHHHDQHRYHPNAHQPQNGQPQYAPPYGGYVPYPLPGTILSAHIGAPQQEGAGAGIQVVYTDDAGTKLSDRVRRRCFNCCTTDTATWRRSNLNSGKVLCNKWGLFERTHSRPRPEHFPHKRGLLAASTLRSQQQQHAHQPYPPPNASGQQQSSPYIALLSGPTRTGTSPSTSQNTAPTSNGAPTSSHQQQQNGTPTQNGATNGSASHAGTPDPNSATSTANNASPRLPGLDSLRPASRGAGQAQGRPASRGKRGKSPE